MTTIRSMLTTTAALVALAGAALAQDDHAEDEHVVVFGDLVIEHAWARAAPAGADTLVFLEIENEGAPDVLAGATTDAARDVTIVGLVIAGDVITTVPVGPVEVPTGVFEMDPGGLALSLAGLTANLVVGEEFALTLTFENAGTVEIHVLVEPAGAMTHSHAH